MFPCFVRLIHVPLITFDPGSRLHAMFSGRFDTKPSEDGSYFIDRDGTHFRYLLNYLRTGQLTVPDDKILRRELLAEAEFYQVEGMISELTARPFRDSVILSSDQRETLMNWLKGTQALNNTRGNLFFGLVYRASRDGWTAADFHSRCDYKGPTVTVITSGKSIFGGYTEQQWKHVGKHFKQAWSWFPHFWVTLLFQGFSDVLVVLLMDVRELLGSLQCAGVPANS